ncbi:31162_t:CDS:2, partial [Racocetra persica]
FDCNPNIGSACGEIKVNLGHRWRNLLNPLVASQNFEYKMSNILDKLFESVFGYISVLPDAFSAYRYKALMNRPLVSYLKGETMHGSGVSKTSIFEANMYLAENRILSFELVIKKHESWKLQYIKSTTSNPATDPFKGHEDKLFDAARSLYLIIIVIVFICSMGNRTKGDNTNTGNLNNMPEEDNKATIKINIIEEEDIDAAYNNIIDELKLKITKKSNTIMPLQRKMIIIDCLEQI